MVPSCSHTHSHTLYSPHNTRSLQHKSPSIFLGQNYNFYFNTHTHRASPLDCALSPPPHTYTHRGSPLDCALSPPPPTHTHRGSPLDFALSHVPDVHLDHDHMSAHAHTHSGTHCGTCRGPPAEEVRGCME